MIDTLQKTSTSNQTHQNDSWMYFPLIAATAYFAYSIYDLQLRKQEMIKLKDELKLVIARNEKSLIEYEMDRKVEIHAVLEENNSLEKEIDKLKIFLEKYLKELNDDIKKHAEKAANLGK